MAAQMNEVPVIGVLVAAVGTVKVAYAAITALVANIGFSSYSLFAQVDAGGGIGAGTVVPATALTATSGALVWVVKQIAAGNLVHRDPAAAEAELAKAASELAEIAAKALKREEALTTMLIQQQGRPHQQQQNTQGGQGPTNG